MGAVAKLQVVEGEVQVLAGVDALLEQYQLRANLLERLAVSHEVERSKLIQAALDAKRANPSLAQAWALGADRQGEIATTCRQQSDCWRNAARDVRLIIERLRGQS